MTKLFRNNRFVGFLKRIFLPVFDKGVYYIKFHKLLSVMGTLFVVLAIVMVVALKSGWGVDKGKLGFYFDPQITECTNVNVEALVNGYYSAYVSGDTDTIKAMSVDPDNVETVKAKNQVIEYFDNFYLHWVEAQEENTYVLYVYWEVKFTGIETKAPGLETFYMVKDGEKFLIKNKLSTSDVEFMTALKESDDSLRLYEITDANLIKALEDQALKDFYDLLLESSK